MLDDYSVGHVGGRDSLGQGEGARVADRAAGCRGGDLAKNSAAYRQSQTWQTTFVLGSHLDRQ